LDHILGYKSRFERLLAKLGDFDPKNTSQTQVKWSKKG